MAEVLYLFLISLLASVMGLVGGLVFLYQKTWGDFLSKFATSLAAGILIFVALQNLIPESIHYIGDFAYFAVLLFLFLAFLLKVLLNKLHKQSHSENIKKTIPFLVVGDSIHNFIDGVAIGTSFVISPILGLFTALSAFAHEVPHEIADFGVMLKAGASKKNIIFINLLSSTTTIIGAFFAYYFSTLNHFVIGILMSISAGVFLYLAIFEFLPSLSDLKRHGFRIFIPFLIGFFLMYLVNQTLPHVHEEELE